ncbi:NADPH-dependent FMN reductase [Listeria floridensis FSL S10-1187]|uniref:NADPH-dependent FMN reductase n=1 Tax=Listeria floridensis FSL S10-1187 TaxID=1265817 RepID=A0ABN0RCZ6_9LIST|nr:flavodoxin family protein [Listeria floridensis]EUJ28033.1 NADPH-dependent FMN reductase [Listeria floridensis FSL S10-1187]
MKVLGILGAQNPDGFTAQLLRQMLDGAKASGAEVSMIVLEEEFLAPKQDEIRQVGKRLKEADCFVFATPTYFGTTSGSMKSFFRHDARLLCSHDE